MTDDEFNAMRTMPDEIHLLSRLAIYDPEKDADRSTEKLLSLDVAKVSGLAASDAFVMKGSVTGYGSGDGRGGWGNPPVERHARSVDAAVLVVPKGLVWSVDDQSASPIGGRAVAVVRTPDGVEPAIRATAEAFDAAPAICAAAILARRAIREHAAGAA